MTKFGTVTQVGEAYFYNSATSTSQGGEAPKPWYDNTFVIVIVVMPALIGGALSDGFV